MFIRKVIKVLASILTTSLILVLCIGNVVFNENAIYSNGIKIVFSTGVLLVIAILSTLLNIFWKDI